MHHTQTFSECKAKQQTVFERIPSLAPKGTASRLTLALAAELPLGASAFLPAKLDPQISQSYADRGNKNLSSLIICANRRHLRITLPPGNSQ